MGTKEKKKEEEKAAKTQEEREFEEAMKIAEWVMHEDRNSLRKLAKS